LLKIVLMSSMSDDNKKKKKFIKDVKEMINDCDNVIVVGIDDVELELLMNDE